MVQPKKRSSEDDFIYSLNYWPKFNVSVFKPLLGCMSL